MTEMIEEADRNGDKMIDKVNNNYYYYYYCMHIERFTVKIQYSNHFIVTVTPCTATTTTLWYCRKNFIVL